MDDGQTGKRVAIGIGILLVLVTVTLILVFTVSQVSSSGCTGPKPLCESPAVLSCEGSFWSCKCGGVTYVQSGGGNTAVSCENPATPVCSENVGWSCMCGTESGSVADQQTCETDQGGTYACDIASNAWNCRCDGISLADKSDEQLACANRGGNYKCVGGNTNGTGPANWECTCVNSITGKYDETPTCGSNETPKCTEVGWVCACGHQDSAASEHLCGRNPGALSCDGTEWVCACKDPIPENCLGQATCVNDRGIWNWACKCGAEKLDAFIATSQCPARGGSVSCNGDSYGCSCVSVSDPNNPASLLDCSDGTGYCDNSGNLQCCLAPGAARTLSDALEQAYKETLASISPDEQVLLDYGVSVYDMISTGGNAKERLREIQNQFVQRLKSKQLPTDWDADTIAEKLQTCTGLAKDAVEPNARNAICDMWDVLYKMKMVELNDLDGLCEGESGSE